MGAKRFYTEYSGLQLFIIQVTKQPYVLRQVLPCMKMLVTTALY